jgi:hypothetical protein
MRFVVKVTTIGGGLLGFLGTTCSSSLRVFLRGTQNLRADTAFGGSFTAADVGTLF